MDAELQARLEASVNRHARRQAPSSPTTGTRRLWAIIEAVAGDGTVTIDYGGQVIAGIHCLATGLELEAGDYVFMQNFHGDLVVLGRIWAGEGDLQSSRRLTRNVYDGTTHTMDETDVNDVVQEFTSATDVTLTIDAGVFQDGDTSEVYQAGAGQVIVVGGAGMSVQAPNGAKTAVQFSSLGLRFRSDSEVVVSGDTTT